MLLRRALITGITGQDGSYLAEWLLEQGYEVHGLIRRSSAFNTSRVEHLYRDPHEEGDGIRLHYGDLLDGSSLDQVLREVKPTEVYHLAAQSHVRVSFELPVYTADVIAMGTLRLLEAIRRAQEQYGSPIRVYQASSSEMFGNAPEMPLTEQSPFRPASPYAIAKVGAHWTAVHYREAYGMHVSAGILFNHESPRRGETFVTRKITRAAGRIVQGLQSDLHLGNLDARRDWGFAGDYVRAMWLMLQQEKPDDYVIATGEDHSVREFLEVAFETAGLDWTKVVHRDARYLRPMEVHRLAGDSLKARKVLGWEPTVPFRDLVSMMVRSDMALAIQERILRTCMKSPC